MSSGIIGNRNSTPDSSLRPPSSARTIGTGHQLRASADMAAFSSSPQLSRARPSSDFYGQSNQGQGQTSTEDASETLAQQWIDDINQNEQTLEEMAAATLDQDFKDELSAIEQWFRVLSEAERTAALYALLQQTTQVQIRFFIQLLQQMGKSHPMSGVLSPANFEKDLMSNRLSDAMGKLSVDGSRPSMARSSVPAAKRLSGLDPSTINAMFPDAAAAIATEKAKFTQQTGNAPSSNRNSAIFDTVRTSLIAPTITTSADPSNNAQPPASPWGTRPADAGRPKSSSGLPPMGQFQQPPPSAGLRSPRTNIPGALNLQNSSLASADGQMIDMPLLSPYAASGNWASMVNTPMVSNFAAAESANQANMVANATAMKLAALSTVNNRFALDDVRKYRRARSTDPSGNGMQGPVSPGMPSSVVMINEHGQIMSRDQVMALQNQQQHQMGMFGGQRSRPNSPGLAMQGSGFGQMNFASPQNNGFLAAYDGSSPLMNSGMGQLGSLNVGSFGLGHEGYISDHSDMIRGRSPRGRRGTSKPPEDPTDPSLLQDIPSWLRSLRLHKYTDNLKDMNWTELVELDEQALEARGVAAVGARRKMLKVFEQVREAKAEGKLS